jgi:hypothetical protein
MARSRGKEKGCGRDLFARRNPGFKSETWATHLILVRAIFIFLGGPRALRQLFQPDVAMRNF